MRQKESNYSKHPLYGYLPDYSLFYVDDLVKTYDVHFKVVSPRKTKLGDCRYPVNRAKQIIITINQDLKPIQFLVTSLHELAHAKTFREFGNKVQPHGIEWKINFSFILNSILHREDISPEEKKVLKSIADKPTATSYGSDHLQTLTKNKHSVFLKDLPNGSNFNFNNKPFKKIKLLRTYVLCSCESSNRKYKIHGLAEINPSPN